MLCTVDQGQSHCAFNIISNSHPFHSKWVDLPIPDIQQFQYFTLKIQGQDHRWGQSSKSQYGTNILSIQIPLPPCQSALPFLFTDFVKISHWKSKVNVIAESHIVGITPYQLIFLSSDEPSHSYMQLFKNLTKVKVLVEVKVESHKVGVTSHQLTSLSFHVNQPFHSRNTKLSKFDLENHRWQWCCTTTGLDNSI